MADDKTEAPTPRKISEAREQGSVPKSTELNTALGLLAAFWLLRGAFGNIAQSLGVFMRQMLTSLPTGDLTADSIAAFQTGGVWNVLLAAMPLYLTIGAVGIITSVTQTGGLFTTAALSPKLDRLNPLNGLRRIISRQGLVEIAKESIKVLIVGWVVYSTVSDSIPRFLSMTTLDLNSAIALFTDIAFGLGARAAWLYLVYAAADYAYQRRQWFNALKMTKQEVMEEVKRQEGDPQIKSRIRAEGRRIARQRMMNKVPQANVVLINPTHLAIALMYDRSKMAAPKVVAKGAMHIAERIVSIARAHGVPVIQNIPLARALYSAVEVDQQIPPALYQAVAEVLAFVFSLKTKRRTTVYQMPSQPAAH
ncbi:MAG: flagellar biosynthesis protein FlhB [Chloroflexi bacterium]|nr:flagellar biosynthesis protein FlhB [Chloroflexota bacterium]